MRGSSDQVHRQGSGSRLGLLLGAGASIAWGIAAAAVALAASNDQSPATQDDDDLEKRNKKAHAELQELLGDRYTLDFDDREAHSRDTNSYHHSRNPFAVVYPLSTEEVSKVVKICARYRLPIIPYGSGTSLEGHTTSPKGGVSVDLSRMDQILQVNVADMDCVVQPGITWNNLNESLLEHKLFFPVDPGPGASIGGMVGTGCSGTNAVRYGTMRVNVINLTVVLPDGSIIKTAQRARKSSAGYDLTRLFVGSEGTLGVITEITLKLQNIPEHTSVATCSFPTIKDAANSVIEIMQKGVQVGCVELLDEECVKSVNAYINTTLEAKPTLFFKFTGRQTQVHDDIQAVSDIVKRHQGGSFQWAKSVDESAKMWEGRKGALWAAAQLREGGQVWTTDVCVPISRFADCIEATKDDLRKSFLPAPVVGHAGDGNFHVLMVMDPNSRKDREEASRLSHLMVERAIEMGGTCTGEHGIGVGKKEYLEKELGEGAVNFMRLLKRSVDPLNIMNPGKIVDVDVSDAAVQQDIARETKPKKSPSVASTVSS